MPSHEISNLVVTRHSLFCDKISVNLDAMAVLIKQLKGMGTTFDDTMAVGLSVAPLNVIELAPVATSIITLFNCYLSWKGVIYCIIEEVKTINSEHSFAICAAAALQLQRDCAICHKTSHVGEISLLNPLNAKCKLNVKADNVNSKMGAGSFSKLTKQTSKNDQNGMSKSQEHPAMAQKSRWNERSADRIMLDGGTTTHPKPKSGKVLDHRVIDSLIYLADDSIISASHVGARKMNVQNDDGNMRISSSDAPIVPDSSMSLLSIPALMSKNIAVMFILGYATLLDIRDVLKSLGCATQDKDGLFYVNDDGSAQPPKTAKSSVARVCAMVAKHEPKLTRKNVDSEDTSGSLIELGINPDKKARDTSAT